MPQYMPMPQYMTPAERAAAYQPQDLRWINGRDSAGRSLWARSLEGPDVHRLTLDERYALADAQYLWERAERAAHHEDAERALPRAHRPLFCDGTREVRECARCGSELTPIGLHPGNNHWRELGPHGRSAGLFALSGVDIRAPEENGWVPSHPSHEWVCGQCVVECIGCGDYLPPTPDGDAICGNCCAECTHCARRGLYDDMYVNTSGDRVCEDCREERYAQCEMCTALVERYAVSRTESGATYCSPCWREVRREGRAGSTVIQNYHSGPRGRVRTVDGPWSKVHRRHIGVELELEVALEGTLWDARVGAGEVDSFGYREERAKALLDWADAQARDIAPNAEGALVRAEHDGSLHYGFELITAPMGLDAQTRLWKSLLTPSLTRGLRSHDTETCGIHVHVSRANLTPFQLSKISVFVNDPQNEKLIRAVARRYATGYCNIKRKKMCIDAGRSDGDRYQAVNLTNRHTVEFRIFRGSLKYETVMAAIEFANAVVEFCGTGSGVGADGLTTNAFLDFMTRPDMHANTRHLRPMLARRMALPDLAARAPSGSEE